MSYHCKILVCVLVCIRAIRHKFKWTHLSFIYLTAEKLEQKCFYTSFALISQHRKTQSILFYVSAIKYDHFYLSCEEPFIGRSILTKSKGFCVSIGKTKAMISEHNTGPIGKSSSLPSSVSLKGVGGIFHLLQ